MDNINSRYTNFLKKYKYEIYEPRVPIFTKERLTINIETNTNNSNKINYKFSRYNSNPRLLSLNGTGIN